MKHIMKQIYFCNIVLSCVILCHANTYDLQTLSNYLYEYNIPNFGKNENFELNLDTLEHCLLNESIHNTNIINNDDTDDTNDTNDNNCNDNQYSKYFDAYKINKILNNINIGQNIIYFKNRINNNLNNFLDKL